MRNVMTIVVAVSMLGPAPLAAAARPCDASISGTAVDATGASLPEYLVRVRSGEDTTRVTMSDKLGRFQVHGLAPGAYTVELVGPDGGIIDASSIAIDAGCSAVSNLVLAAEGSGSMAQATGAGFFSSHATQLLMAAIGGGVSAGVIAARRDASPSR
jgi:hypothetical protein